MLDRKMNAELAFNGNSVEITHRAFNGYNQGVRFETNTLENGEKEFCVYLQHKSGWRLIESCDYTDKGKKSRLIGDAMQDLIMGISRT